MRKYCLSAGECENLSAEYDIHVFDFAYGLRLLQACIFNANDVYVGRSAYGDFGDWLGDLLVLVDEGFEYLERAADTDESGDVEAEEVEDRDWDPGTKVNKVTVSELMDLMRDLAESLEYALEAIPEATVGQGLSDEEYERLDEEVASVAMRVRDVALEASSFLARTRFHATGSKGADPNASNLQCVESMFGTAPCDSN